MPIAPRLRDLGDRKLYTIEKTSSYPDLDLLIGGAVNVKQITEHWDELLRLTASLRLGTVTASLMLRKLASYPRQNGLAWALREVGRSEKTLFTLEELRGEGVEMTSEQLRHLSPMDWEHIGLTGDYTWDFTPKTTRV